MKKDFLLKNSSAKKLYRAVREQPIYDFHCHLSAEDIYLNRRFDNVGSLLLGADHYKWRLERGCGVEETFITGAAPWEEKFRAYAHALERSCGNPLTDWTAMELSAYFGIDRPLTEQNASELFKEANMHLAREELSPRRIIVRSGVRYIATTNDPCESLDFHRRLNADLSFPVTVAPTFRTDRLMQIASDGYSDYLARLSKASGVEITGMDSFLEAVTARLDAFCEAGCRLSDVGIEQFPRIVGRADEATDILEKALNGDEINATEQALFAGFLFVFLGCEYRQRGICMQWHMAVRRDACHSLSAALGADCGSDCMGDEIPNNAILAILNEIDSSGGLPQTVLYTLNPSMAPRLASLCASFRSVVPGAAWWFCDTREGIEAQLRTAAQAGSLSAFPGMVTDSRSFVSYVRHDYFRRILVNLLGEWVEDGVCTYQNAERLAILLASGNAKSIAQTGSLPGYVRQTR